MYTGSQDPTTEVSFNLEDIECKVYTEDGKVTNIGSVLDYGWFFMTNIVNYETVRKKRTRGILWWRRNRWGYTRVPVPTGGIKCTVDWEMYETLFDLGLMRERKPKGGAGILALEWIITANSGKYTIKVGDEINWRINGSFKNAGGEYRQGYFFPLDYTGAKTAVNIQGQGAYDHLLAEANTAQAPFWVYSGSTGGASTIHDPSILVMSSSNMNEAYGTTFRQGEVEYFPGPSDYFPGGVEPKTTNFDPIQYTIELKEGDEIRFANNENFTYRVIEVFAPSENVESGTARLKVKLDRPVDTSVNKDFFLVRRPIVNPNSLYLDTPFPYATLSSASISTGIANTGSANFGLTGNIDENGNYTASYSDLEVASTPGILYPDFPTEYLVQSASIIVNDLISKGIIES
jgi:plastocyanin